MKRILFFSFFLLAISSVAILAAGCLSTAPDGKGSKDEKGNQRDPSEILAVGTTAPAIDSKDNEGNTIKLASYLGKSNVVLIFYPGDNTPTCTSQLCAVRDDWKKFELAEVEVFGVNPATEDSHREFFKSHNFPFPLLSDTSGEIVRDYGCRGLLGVTTRTVYGIDKSGKIVYAQRGKPANDEILAAFKK